MISRITIAMRQNFLTFPALYGNSPPALAFDIFSRCMQNWETVLFCLVDDATSIWKGEMDRGREAYKN